MKISSELVGKVVRIYWEIETYFVGCVLDVTDDWILLQPISEGNQSDGYYMLRQGECLYYADVFPEHSIIVASDVLSKTDHTLVASLDKSIAFAIATQSTVTIRFSFGEVLVGKVAECVNNHVRINEYDRAGRFTVSKVAPVAEISRLSVHIV